MLMLTIIVLLFFIIDYRDALILTGWGIEGECERYCPDHEFPFDMGDGLANMHPGPATLPGLFLS